MASPYDYTFDCQALQGLVSGQTIKVTHWQGTEAMSRPYRFEITFAVQQADLALEQLLNQSATLAGHTPDGTPVRWHGIVTQGVQQGCDETYHYYQVVLEPRLVRLRTMVWSDIYLNQQLDDIIRQLLRLANLEEPYSNATAPYDYRISATGLTATRAPFVCQFEESCLDFLMRKLEYYGVYFWFEQGQDQESVVFANSADQQPSEADNVVYYPRGILNPDAKEVAITRLNRRVALHPKTVTLHDSNEQGNTALSLNSQTQVPSPVQGLGEVHSSADHFEKLQDENSISGTTLATWRAQEIACRRLRVEGEARTPGVCAGRLISVSEYLRGADPVQYYVIEATHEGTQTLETAPETDQPSYVARFVALPRWQDPNKPGEPLQYRPARSTPVPVVSRLVNGFVDTGTPDQPKQFAQPDDDGRYKVRLTFPRQRYDGNQNSAWLRMATPYAGGASTAGLAAAGMHFPLREDTEVLIAFLNGNPDRPVIVAALPNVEAPSVVNAQNAAEHVIRTPSGNVLAFRDSAESESGDSESGPPSIHLSSPTEESLLNLGKSDDEEVADGFHLATAGHGEIVAESSMLIEVPGHLRITAGSDALSGFLSSEVEGLPQGISIGTSGGIAIENFLGVKIETVEAISVGHFFGGKVEMTEAAIIETTLGAKLAIEAVIAKEINLLEKSHVSDNNTHTNVFTQWIAAKWEGILAEKTETAAEITVNALESYKLFTPLSAFIGTATSSIQLDPATLTVSTLDATIEGATSAVMHSAVETLIAGGISTLTLSNEVAMLDTMSLKLSATAGVSITTAGEATLNGSIIMVG